MPRFRYLGSNVGEWYINSSAVTTSSSTIWHAWCDNQNAAIACSDSANAWTMWNVDYESRCAGNQQAGAAQQQMQHMQNQLYNNVIDGMAQRDLAGGQAGWAENTKKATERARELLLASLDELQAEEFKKTRSFVVHSKKGDKKYLVTYGTAGNILEFVGDKRVAKYCIHPAEDLPTPDVMLAQKLMIETDEELFLKIANRTAIAA